VLERIRRSADIQSKMKTKILAILLLTVAALGYGEGFAVLLENAEAEDFYYTLDPPELAGFNPVGSVFSGILYDFFTEPRGDADAEFKLLAAGETLRLTDLEEGTHLIVGFFAVPGRALFPVRVLRIQAGGGIAERFYTLYAEPSSFSAKAGLGRLRGFAVPAASPAADTGQTVREAVLPAEEAPSAETVLPGEAAPTGGIAIDNSYKDWEKVPFLAGFAEGFAPVSFTREEYGKDFQALPLKEARYWQSGGSALSEIKAVAAAERLYIFASTYSAIADNMSIFLYIHGPAGGGRENSVTLELVPAGAFEPGLVVLWERGREPRLAGRLFSGSFFLEAEIDMEPLRRALNRTIGESYAPEDLRVDLTSCYFDRSGLIYEEFFFTSLSLLDIPRPEEIAF